MKNIQNVQNKTLAIIFNIALDSIFYSSSVVRINMNLYKNSLLNCYSLERMIEKCRFKFM